MANQMRLDKFLSHLRIGTRKESKLLVRAGRIRINGVVTKDCAVKVYPGSDRISLDGQDLVYREFIYLMMNKPAGYVSATRDRSEKTVLDLLPPAWTGWGLFPIGRLDKDTEGLLLLSNNGQLAHTLLSPKYQVGKTYFARINGAIGPEELEQLQTGIELDDGYRTKPAMARVLRAGDTYDVELVIYEGKFHQVKRMFAAVGRKVLYLKRTAIGGLKLDSSLKPGEVRELTEAEVAILMCGSVFSPHDA